MEPVREERARRMSRAPGSALPATAGCGDKQEGYEAVTVSLAGGIRGPSSKTRPWSPAAETSSTMERLPKRSVCEPPWIRKAIGSPAEQSPVGESPDHSSEQLGMVEASMEQLA